MPFDPKLCRNESEVESKLIVQYLLPHLGYSPDSWYQEVAVGSIRLDFLLFATQVVPFVLDANSPLSVVMEAKHPNQNLDRHTRRLRSYLIHLNVRYGLLTNGKEIRIYEKLKSEVKLIFQCSGQELDAQIDKLKSIIGRNELKKGAVNDLDILNIEADQIDSCLVRENSTSFLEMTNNQQTNLDWESNPLISPAYQELKRIEQLCYPIPENRIKKNMKIIAIYHNKGGVGKTTTVVNLAAALRKKGNRVLVIDLDSQANTTFATGLIKFDDEELDDIRDCNILHVLQSEDFYPIEEVARESQFSSPEIHVVPSHIDLMHYENDLNALDYSRMILIQKLEPLKEEYDIVLIDTPPSLNLYARIALIAADYLIIPSDLKPFANQGLINVKDFVKKVNAFRKQIGKQPLEILGVLACKISTNAKFAQATLKKRIRAVEERYHLNVMDTIIYERDDLAKCAEKVQIVGDVEIVDPMSVIDFKPDSPSAQEFDLLAMEVSQKIGMAVSTTPPTRGGACP